MRERVADGGDIHPVRRPGALRVMKPMGIALEDRVLAGLVAQNRHPVADTAERHGFDAVDADRGLDSPVRLRFEQCRRDTGSNRIDAFFAQIGNDLKPASRVESNTEPLRNFLLFPNRLAVQPVGRARSRQNQLGGIDGNRRRHQTKCEIDS